ncbi:MAG: hypothetical protein QW041_00305 [Candidatus Pacearchaeota archaeon]
MIEEKETEFMKFIEKHKEYPASSILVNYLDMHTKQEKSEDDIFRIIEKEKIPEYIAMIKKMTKENEKLNKINSKEYI